MDELPFHKVFIDSRAASLGTASSFEVTLPETLSLSREAVCYVTDIAISHSFWSVDGAGTVGGANHYVYFVELSAVGASPVLCRAALTEGSYTAEELGGELAARMTAASAAQETYTAAYLTSLNALQVSSSGGFFFADKGLLQDAQFQAYFASRLQTGAGAYTVSWAAPEDCCGLLGLASGGSKNVTFAELQALLAVGLPVQKRHGPRGRAAPPLPLPAQPGVGQPPRPGPRRKPDRAGACARGQCLRRPHRQAAQRACARLSAVRRPDAAHA